MARMNETLAASLELLRSRFRESEEKSRRDLEHLEARAKSLKESILSGNFPPKDGASLPSIAPPSGRDVGESSTIRSRPQRVPRSTTKLQVNPEESATSKPVDSKDNVMKSDGISGTSSGPEELSGAKSTLVGNKVPLSKQSIGANSTFIVPKDPLPKESIGANSTFIVPKDPLPKESIGANSTYVIDDSKRISHDYSLRSISKECVSAPKFSGKKTYPPQNVYSERKYMTQNTGKAASDEKFQTNTTGACEMSGSETGDTAHLKKLARKSVGRAIKIANGAKLNKEMFLRDVQRYGQSKGSQIVKTFKENSKSSHSDSDPLKALTERAMRACARRDEILKKRAIEAKLNRERVEKFLAAKDEKEREKVLLKVVKDRVENVAIGKQVAKSVLKQSHNDIGVNALGEPNLKSHMASVKGNFKPSKPDQKYYQKYCNAGGMQNDCDNSYDATLSPKDRQPLASKSQDDYGLDDADSDASSDEESNPKKIVPKWAKGVPREAELMCQNEVSRLAVHSFFGSKESTPDLGKIFTGIDCRLLVRRSSAAWK